MIKSKVKVILIPLFLATCFFAFAQVNINYANTINEEFNITGEADGDGTNIEIVILNGTTIWTKENSPYRIYNDIKIPEDAALIIEEGVTVEFQGKYVLAVYGRIEANGTPDENIVFTVKDKPQIPPEEYDAAAQSGVDLGWHGIIIDHESAAESKPCIFKYCIFEYGIKDGNNANIDPSITFSDGRVWHRGGAIHARQLANCDLVVLYSIFRKNYSTTGGAAVELLYGLGRGIIVGNVFIENFSNDHTEYASDKRGGTLRFTHSRSWAVNNSFIHNKSPYASSGAITIFDAGYDDLYPTFIDRYFLENNLFYDNEPEGVYDYHNDPPLMGLHSLIIDPAKEPFVDLENGDYTPVLPEIINMGTNAIDPEPAEDDPYYHKAFSDNMKKVLAYIVDGLLENNKTPLLDIYGNARPLDNTMDVGAVEAFSGQNIPVTGVNISSEGGVTTIYTGGTLQFYAQVLPANATNKTVTWDTSNASVATINANGLVTAQNQGEAIITVTTDDGGFTDTSVIQVAPAPPVPVTGVTISPASVVLAPTGTQQLTAAVLPADATDKNITWSTNNPAVATVSPSGLVTAMEDGAAVITVTTNVGGYTATCSVHVSSGGGANLLLNPGFEDGSAHWTLARVFSISTADKYSGLQSLLLSGAGSSSYTPQEVTLKPNTDYILTAYIKGNARLFMGMKSFWGGAYASAYITPTSDWVQYTLIFNSNNYPEIHRVFFLDAPYQPISNATSYIDDVELIESSGLTSAN